VGGGEHAVVLGHPVPSAPHPATAMKLGVMQPYFFPYIGYFDLIHSVDRWVVADTVQYIRHGWINRNRVLHPTSGWQYIIVPVRKHHREIPINEIQIAEGSDWRERTLNQLRHYRGRAPHFGAVMTLVDDCLNMSDQSLSRLNVAIMRRVCHFLEIPFVFHTLSEMGLALGPIEGPGDWALRIAEALGAREYINPPGGSELFDNAKFAASGIRLTIQPPVEFTYECQGYRFEPMLSIIDVLMWNSRERIGAFLAERRREMNRAVSTDMPLRE
jgi:WbqC-like protein family